MVLLILRFGMSPFLMTRQPELPFPHAGIRRTTRGPCRLAAALAALLWLAAPAPAGGLFGIRVVDEATGRGVPLVTLETTHRIRCVTDSAGWVAFGEPGLLGRKVHFLVSSPGYEFPKDGFGIAGSSVETAAGKTATLKVKRLNIAERRYRITGAAVYGDSELLGIATPWAAPADGGGVVGQDSVQATVAGGKVFWVWGDTTVADYPLGNFQTTGAWSELPGHGGLEPDVGIKLAYLAGPDGKLRHMVPLAEPGPVWLDGLLAVRDRSGREHIVAHYARMKSLSEQVEHGLCRLEDDGVFHRVRKLDDAEKWRHPRGHAVRVKAGGREDFYFASPFCTTRVPARYEDLVEPAAYEALAWDGKGWAWRNDRAPWSQQDEAKAAKAGSIPEARTRFQTTDAASGRPVAMHAGTVRWNAFRQRWVLVAVQHDGAESFLGEVWYAEAPAPDGPWGKAVKIASHPSYSFYNPCHHDFLDEQGGRIISFEGTYAETFSGAKVATPRYDYNQILYRLDLADPRLEAARETKATGQ